MSVVSRDAEITALEQAVRGLVAGESPLVDICGPHGSGRSTLVRHAVYEARRQGAVVLTAFGAADAPGHVASQLEASSTVLPDVKQMLVMDREVTDTRSTARSYTGDWQLFKAVLTAQVSQTVTTEHSVRGNHQVRIEVNPHRTFGVTGYIRTWMVYSEVTERNTNCNYKTTNVQGEVATTDGIIWRASDIGGA